MKKTLLFLALILIITVGYLSMPTTLPTHAPTRDYLDMEATLVEQFILAKDSSTIVLPEGHFSFHSP